MTNKIKSANLDVQTRIDFSPDAAGGTKPFVNISDLAEGSLPKNHVFIRHDTAERNDATTIQIQKLVNTDDYDGGANPAYVNPKALRVLTQVNVDTQQAEYAISGEMTTYSNESSLGCTAVSGTAFKYGITNLFAGHFQAKDMIKVAAPTDVTALIGIEINTPAVGLDHPTANDSTGLRRCLEVIARTNEVAGWDTVSGNYGNGEIGVGMNIRTDNTTDGYFRYGLMVNDVAQKPGNPNSIMTGVAIRTSGQYGMNITGSNTAANIRVVGAGTDYGLKAEGTFAFAAVGIPENQFIQLGVAATERVLMRYNSATNKIEFSKGGIVRASIDMAVSVGDLT